MMDSGKSWPSLAVQCPPRYIAMVREFHDGMQARVKMMGSSLNLLM